MTKFSHPREKKKSLKWEYNKKGNKKNSSGGISRRGKGTEWWPGEAPGKMRTLQELPRTATAQDAKDPPPVTHPVSSG